MLTRNPVSLVIIAIYLLALLYLFVSGPVEPQTLLVGIFYTVGVVLALWAGWTMRTTSWKITPDVANEAILIENGPYTYVRHPMYLSVIVVALGLLFSFSVLNRHLHRTHTDLRPLLTVLLVITPPSQVGASDSARGGQGWYPECPHGSGFRAWQTALRPRGN